MLHAGLAKVDYMLLLLLQCTRGYAAIPPILAHWQHWLFKGIYEHIMGIAIWWHGVQMGIINGLMSGNRLALSSSLPMLQYLQVPAVQRMKHYLTLRIALNLGYSPIGGKIEGLIYGDRIA